jgi:hypothetical protein
MAARELKAENLDFWIKNNLNVLMEGKHGCGKTTQIIEAFERAGIKWRYFSAATLDPWVDLIGVPKEVKDENGISYLELIRPREFAYDEVEAIFFDEFNRSHKKVRNACMELIQFQSINGKKLNNLKIVWAAINPSDEEGGYDVEKLDPAQSDRFHVHTNIPYKPSVPFFTKKYEENGRSAATWWLELPPAEQNKVSPRRLDYAMQVWQMGGDLNWVLPESSGVEKLIQTIKVGPISMKLLKFLKKNDSAGAKKFFEDENTVVFAVEWLFSEKQKKSDRFDFFVPLLPLERIAQLAVKDQSFCSYMMNKATQPWSGAAVYIRVLNDIVNANTNVEIVKHIKSHAKKDAQFGLLIEDPTVITKAANANFGTNPAKPHQPKRGYSTDYIGWLKKERNNLDDWSRTTNNRIKLLEEIQRQIPPNISAPDALETLDVLQMIAVSSHVNSLISKTEFKPFMPIVNYLIQEIAKNTNKNWDEIRESFFKKRFLRLYEKIGSSKALAEKILCPTKPTDLIKKSNLNSPV